jgi:hypothetical protein
VIVLRLFGVEVLAVGSLEPHETWYSTAGGVELADPALDERDHDVHLASRRHRPAVVAIGSRRNELRRSFILVG